METHDNTNNTPGTAENSGMILDNEWQAIKGKIDSTDDIDFFMVLVPPETTKMSLAVCYNKKNLLLWQMNSSPWK